MKNNLIMNSFIMLQMNNSEKPISKFTKLYFWYYKLIGVNFGGYSLDQNGFLKKSFAWKLYGYFYILISVILLWSITVDFMYSDQMKMLKRSNRSFIYELVLISYLVRNNLPLITLIIGHRNGLQLIRLIIKYSNENRKLNMTFKSLWLIHLTTCLMSVFFYYYHYYDYIFTKFDVKTLINLYSGFTENLIFISINYSISFICWQISFSVYDKLNKMKNQLIKSKCNLYEVISMRKQFLEMRNDLVEADLCTRFGFFIDCASITFTLMLNIYLFVAGNQFHTWFASFISYCLIITPKLIGDCIICGMVHDQANRLLKSVHQVDFDIKNDRFYKELMLFKTINPEINFGFSFGGLVPLERTALLSVNCISHYFESI